MLRVLSSIGITAALFPIFAWFVHVIRSGFEFASNPFSYASPLAILCLIFILIFGLPWLPYLRKRQFIGFLPVVSLAGVMGASSFVVYSLLLLLDQTWSQGKFPTRWATSNWSTFVDLATTTFSFGVFCGVCIWLIGIYRNRWFRI
jgi:hypothetical protein